MVMITHKHATRYAQESPIECVTLFDQWAEIKRKLFLDLQEGGNEIIITCISPYMIDGTFRFDAQDEAKIRCVRIGDSTSLLDLLHTSASNHRPMQNELESPKDRKRTFENRLAFCTKRFKQIEDAFADAVETPSYEGPDATKRWENFINEQKTRWEEIRTQETIQMQELQKSYDVLQTLEEKIINKSSSKYKPKEVTAFVKSDRTQSVLITITYHVKNVGWHAAYDIRLISEEKRKTLKVDYLAIIHQNSEEKWEDAALKLSTANPILDGGVMKYGTLCANTGDSNLPREPSVQDALQSSGTTDGSSLSTGSERSALSTLLIPFRGTITSDAKEHQFTVETLKFDPKIMYETFPSRSTRVFLVAHAENHSLNLLLAGCAKLYLDNNYVAQIDMDQICQGEPFHFQFGTDEEIKVEYKVEQIKTVKCESSLEHHKREIKIMNTKNETIRILVREHIPKSNDEKIKIKLIEPKLDQITQDEDETQPRSLLPPIGCRLDKNHNLEWVLEIDAESEKSLFIKWSLEYPPGNAIHYREIFSN